MLPTQPEREGTSFSILPKIMLLRSALHSVHIEFFVCCFLNRLSFPFFCQVFFVESICDDPDVIAANILVNDE